MKKLLTALIVATLLVSAVWAGGNRQQEANQELTGLYAAEIPTLNYFTESSSSTFAVAAMLLDGLVENNRYGVQIPNIAEKWESSSNGLTWTFTLRKDVKWVDYTGKVVANVTANDFVSAAKYNLTQANTPYYDNFYTDFFVGAQAYWDSTAPGKTPLNFSTVGVKAINDYTLQYTLIEPCPYFMSMMGWVAFYPIYEPFLNQVGKQFGTSNDKFLYCGAYRLETWQPQNQQVFVKNTNYYLANEIHVTKITNRYNAEASTIGPEMFRRGEITATEIPSTIQDEWLANPDLAKLIRPELPEPYFYFYALNFDPQFPAEYEPENWKIAVNNLNFRKALFAALDRVAAMSTAYPSNPQSLLYRTITPPGFCTVNGRDYTQIGDLARITSTQPFDTAAAQRYRDAARTELRAAGATFPIKVLMPYNTSSTSWGQRVQVVKQNLERVLGADFIQIMIYDAPPTSFLANNRRNGRFALMECNWGPDYADPETFTDPFMLGGSIYNKPWLATGNTGTTYTNLVNTAKAEKVDIAKRYELFARAEAYLIDNAIVIPYARYVPGYIATYTNPFDGNYSPSSAMSANKMNNIRKLPAPIGVAEYQTLYAQWEKEREAAVRASVPR